MDDCAYIPSAEAPGDDRGTEQRAGRRGTADGSVQHTPRVFDFEAAEKSREKKERKAAGHEAKGHHEKAVQQALHELRTSGELTKQAWGEVYSGARLAPSIEQLRNAHGFDISGHGTLKDPYVLTSKWQRPSLVKTTDEIKLAYYADPHWKQVRKQRLGEDRSACVLCRFSDEALLQVHHIRYELFAEQMHHLMTVCEECHEMIHEGCRMAFPVGMTIEHVQRLGVPVVFEPWLMPEYCFGGAAIVHITDSNLRSEECPVESAEPGGCAGHPGQGGGNQNTDEVGGGISGSPESGSGDQTESGKEGWDASF